ncbi:hypothetical protein RclHR1_00150008 [Rhizophagus clarus]|uniref:Uncharacterized protein n=1 Tax=Rhizophagus clarus TaxID=94130 RepID=A0A2Z6QIA7_9GLOM|nr:hypothetical protein RclHR1_00150008 [Rhizophagus clarus]
MKSLLNILPPVEEITQKLSGSKYVMLSLVYPTLALLLKRTRTGVDFGDDEDNIDEVKYELYTDTNGRRRKKKKPIDISSPFDPTGVEIKVRKILYRVISQFGEILDLWQAY